MTSIGDSVAHYRILEKIGEGGMGVVYKAEDTRLQRTVALKFLPPELTRDPQAKSRLIQEARAAAALDHPNICPVYEIGEAEGTMFIAMPCVIGRSLKEAIAAGPLSIDDAMDIAWQVAEGLRGAHEKGIIHRDIKPANIMLAEKGQAKIMDFGLAKHTGIADVTKTLAVTGTPAYMSPEQARGEAVDLRTDIWSFGATLYEMLTGQMPFGRKHDQALIYSILNEIPEPLTRARPELPAQLDLIVQKALEKDKSRRYQDMAALLRDLKAVRASASVEPKPGKSIIVLPFEDISPGKDNEYFSDGLTEEIITDLSHVHGLLVISRSSAMTFKGTKKKIPEIAREVNARYVLEGSVRKAKDSLRITAQLIDGANDAHLWAEKYSGSLDDVFDIQEKVSRSIVEALEVKLTSEESVRLSERPIENVAAYECFLKAKHDIWSFTKEGTERALQYTHNALDILGENATLYAGLGMAHFQLVNIGVRQDEHLVKARDYVRKAFALDPGSSQAHAARGYLYYLEADMRRAISHLKEAASRNPSDADTWIWLGFFCLLMGKSAAAARYYERGLRVDPINPLWRWSGGIIPFFEGRFDLAAEQLRHGYETTPDVPMFRFWYALSLAYAKRFEESRSALDIGPELSASDDSFMKMSRALRAALRGDEDALSRLLIPETVETFRRDPQCAYHLASFYGFLNRPEAALAWLQTAIELGIRPYPLMAADPFLDNIRHELRFVKLMERVKRDWEDFEA